MKLANMLFNKTTYQNNLPNNHTIVERSSGSVGVDFKTNDLVLSCIAPIVSAAGKLTAKHILEEQVLETSPIVDVLTEPNEVDSLQSLLEKLTTQLQLNNNAYAIIKKDKYGKPLSITPLTDVSSAVMEQSKSGNYFINFTLSSGTKKLLPLADVIHLKQHHNNSLFFGTNPAVILNDILQVIDDADKSISDAIQQSQAIKYLIKANTVLPDSELKNMTDKFAKLFMEEGKGIAAVDASADIIEFKGKNSYVPDLSLQQNKVERIYSYFGVTPEIVNNNYNEDEYASFYESRVEPLLIQLSNEFTRKLFNKIERKKGNKIIFESTNLQFASMESKIKLTEFIDRGLMTPNEVRKILNLPAIADGDTPIRRLDTALVTDDRFKGGDED